MKTPFSNLTVIVERGRVIAFEELPANSIALDGYVQGPALDNVQRRYSFDHHAGCVRLVTKATCAQVLDALLLGLEPSGMQVFLNDIDGDTVLAVWLLSHPEMARQVTVRSLVDDVEHTDAHGPAYRPFLKNPELCRQFYQGVMAPEHEARKNRSFETIELKQLLWDCLQRLEQLLIEQQQFELSEPPKRTYQITHQGLGWLMVTSPDMVFDLLYADGHVRAVVWQPFQLMDGRTSWAYTIGKQSDLVSGFDIPGILKTLADVEPGWGGGSTIGGAPRQADGSRSFLEPDDVFAVIEGLVRQKKKW